MDLINIPEIRRKYIIERIAFPIVGILLCFLTIGIVFIWKISDDYSNAIYAFCLSFLLILYPFISYSLLLRSIKILDSDIYNKLYSDFSNKKYSYFALLDLLVFQEYIVSLKFGFKVIKLSDISQIQLYSYKIRHSNLKLTDKNGNKHFIAFVTDARTFEEILILRKYLRKKEPGISFILEAHKYLK